jgi:methylmalonyl-CoA/ethylmalonyl-CoA epimerase
VVTGGWLGLGPLGQIGVVTADLDAAIDRRRRLQPAADWRCWTYDQNFLGWQRIGERAVPWSIRLAISGVNPQLELVQPLHGDTSLARKLARDGESIHHVGIFVDDFAAEADRLAAMGIARLESGGGHGLDGDGAFGYFDTTDICGVIVELIESPARRPAPHKSFAAEPSGGYPASTGGER